MTNQITAEIYKEKMVGKRYRHFKGNIYIGRHRNLNVFTDKTGNVQIRRILRINGIKLWTKVENKRSVFKKTYGF